MRLGCDAGDGRDVRRRPLHARGAGGCRLPGKPDLLAILKRDRAVGRKQRSRKNLLLVAFMRIRFVDGLRASTEQHEQRHTALRNALCLRQPEPQPSGIAVAYGACRNGARYKLRPSGR